MRMPASAVSPATHAMRAHLPAAQRAPRPAACTAPSAAHRVAQRCEPHTACAAQQPKSHSVERSNSCPKTTCAHPALLLALILMHCCSARVSNPIPRLVRPKLADLAEPGLRSQPVEHLNPWPKTTCAQSLPLLELTPTIPSSTSVSASFTRLHLAPARPPSCGLTHMPTFCCTLACIQTCRSVHGPHTHTPVDSGRPRAHDGAFGPDPSTSVLGGSPTEPLYTHRTLYSSDYISQTPETPRAPRAPKALRTPTHYLHPLTSILDTANCWGPPAIAFPTVPGSGRSG